MNRRASQRVFAAMLSLLFALTAASASVFAVDDGSVGGTQSGNTNHPSTGEGTTDVWAGVSVDYMFPMRYEVYDEAGQPLEGVSIEHYDYTGGEYLFVGRTDATGVWETEVTPEYWMSNVQTAPSEGEAAVVDTTGTYTGAGPLRHRVSKEGFITQEGQTEILVEEMNGKATAVVRVHMTGEETPPGTGDTGSDGNGNNANGGNNNNANNTNTTSSAANGLPRTGVANYWLCFAAAGSLLLVAALLLLRMLRAEEKKQCKKTTGGQTE